MTVLTAPAATGRLIVSTVVAIIAMLPIASHAVRLSGNGHGQALVYPLYTARSTVSNNSFVTALSVTNLTGNAKALKVRFFEGKAGAPVLDFNLYLSRYDMWTAGVVAAGSGAGLFSLDNSCTSLPLSRSSQSPTLFRNSAYATEPWGDSLDRTYEGYLEILEMGAIAPGSQLELVVTHKSNLSAPNMSTPSCGVLPSGSAVPADLSRPTGGLTGNASLINVNEGTDYSVDAIALAQWSDKVQWGEPGNLHPDLSDASPAVSSVVDAGTNGDVMIVTRWDTGRDAVTALFMADSINNDYTVEPYIKATTDWIVTMPTKRFYMNGLTGSSPFMTQSSQSGGQHVSLLYYDREEQSLVDNPCILFFPYCGPYDPDPVLPFVSTTIPWKLNHGPSMSGLTLGGRNVASPGLTSLDGAWVNGWGELKLGGAATSVLVAPPGQSTTTDTLTGVTTTGVNVTYHGLPVVGFSAQSYSTNGLPGVNASVLSNYGGSFVHRVKRRIDISK